jgi:peroxiredoxin
MKRFLVYVPVVAIAALLIGMFGIAMPDAAQKVVDGAMLANASACDSLQAAADNPVLGRMPARAPDFTLKDYAGRSYSLSSLRGNVVLVNFWATWCSTCVVEMPSMEKLVEKMRGKNFRLLAVSVDDDWTAVRNFFPKGSPLEILLDTERAVPKRYGTEKFPESFIIDKAGNIAYYVVSDRDWNQPDIMSCMESML